MIDTRMKASLTAVVTALRACAETVEALARTLDSSREDRSPASATDQWPELMSTSVAARYCGYKTTSGLRKAHLDKKVFPVGRRGGAGSWSWARADLDRFLRGGAPAAGQDVSTRMPSEPPPRSESERRPPERERRPTAKRRHSPATEAALARIREIARKPPT
jgi:hypothetical protein